MFAVSPCPFAPIKHLEHERRQITASHTGVLVHFRLSEDPRVTLPVFHRAGYDTGAVTPGGPSGAPGCYSEQGGLFFLVACPPEHQALKLRAANPPALLTWLLPLVSKPDQTRLPKASLKINTKTDRQLDAH